MNNKGNVALWAILAVVLVLGVGVGIRYYTQKTEQPTRMVENIYKTGEIWREAKLPNGNIVFIKDHNLYIHNPSSGDVLITENIPKSLGLPPANYKVTLDEWFGEDPVLLTSDFYGFITISKEQDKFAFVYQRLQKDAITKDEGFYSYATHSKLLVYSLDGKPLATHELNIGSSYGLSYFDKEKAVFEGATTKGPLPTITYLLENGKLTQAGTDWKTYRNDELGFKFSYPNDINVSPGEILYLSTAPSGQTPSIRIDMNNGAGFMTFGCTSENPYDNFSEIGKGKNINLNIEGKSIKVIGKNVSCTQGPCYDYVMTKISICSEKPEVRPEGAFCLAYYSYAPLVDLDTQILQSVKFLKPIDSWDNNLCVWAGGRG